MRIPVFLYRGKSIKTKEWVSGYVNRCEAKLTYTEQFSGNPRTWIQAVDADGFAMKLVQIDPATLCVGFTVSDHSVKTYYTGDVCEVRGEDGYFVVEYDENTARFILSNDEVTTDFDHVYNREISVIGNIFDNPDLLGRTTRP